MKKCMSRDMTAKDRSNTVFQLTHLDSGGCLCGRMYHYIQFARKVVPECHDGRHVTGYSEMSGNSL